MALLKRKAFVGNDFEKTNLEDIFVELTESSSRDIEPTEKEETDK